MQEEENAGGAMVVGVRVKDLVCTNLQVYQEAKPVFIMYQPKRRTSTT